MKVANTIAERIDAESVFAPNGCRVWCGSANYDGYGRITVGSRTDGTRRAMLVHRLAWEAERGRIPDGLVVDHVCRNRRCVRVDHLRVVTRAVNTTENSNSWSAVNAAKDRCPKCGGEYESRSNGRICPPCNNAMHAAKYKRKRDRINADRRRKRAEDPEAARAADRAYWAANRERLREQHRERYRARRNA